MTREALEISRNRARSARRRRLPAAPPSRRREPPLLGRGERRLGVPDPALDIGRSQLRLPEPEDRFAFEILVGPDRHDPDRPHRPPAERLEDLPVLLLGDLLRRAERREPLELRVDLLGLAEVP